VIGGSNVPGMDILDPTLSVGGGVLTVTTHLADLSNPAATASTLSAGFLQYVTRWQMCNTIYYAAMENTAANSPIYYAGAARSIDLCSVSACFPHVITYPEASFGGIAETGSVSCPASPSSSNPCTLTVHVNLADVGAPSSSLLEEVGTYSFAAVQQQGALTNAQALSDTVPLQVDGLCCFNFSAPAAVTAPTPTPAPAAGGALPNSTGPARPVPWLRLGVVLFGVLLSVAALMARRRARRP